MTTQAPDATVEALRAAVDRMVDEVREGTRTLSDGYSVTPDGAMRQRKAIDRIHLAVATFANEVAAHEVAEPAGGLDALIEDGRKWRAAEAEGHVVTFREDGYGLMHPPSCRPDLIGCMFNEWLAGQPGPDEEPGRYRMTWATSGPKYARLSESHP